MNLHSVLHNVKTAAILIVQQLLYIHQRKNVSKVWNHKPTTYQWMDWLYLNIAQSARLVFDSIKSNFRCYCKLM